MDSLAGLLTRYARAEREAAQALGEFTLFGLFERSDSPGRFDIIVSAPWLGMGRDAILKVIPYLPDLEPGESALIGSLFPLPPDIEFVQIVIGILRDGGGYTLDNGVRALGFGQSGLSDVEIMRCYVIAASGMAAARPAEAVAA